MRFDVLFSLWLVVSGKTEFQTTQLQRTRRTVHFERRPSQRFARRQSHVLRERRNPAVADASASSDVAVVGPETDSTRCKSPAKEDPAVIVDGSAEERLDHLIKSLNVKESGDSSEVPLGELGPVGQSREKEAKSRVRGSSPAKAGGVSLPIVLTDSSFEVVATSEEGKFALLVGSRLNHIKLIRV